MEAIMRTISKKIIFSFALFVLLGLCVVVYAGKDTSFAVVPDNPSDSKDADITNYEPESFFESVESMEKRELLRKIFYYPSDLLENSPVDKNLFRTALIRAIFFLHFYDFVLYFF